MISDPDSTEIPTSFCSGCGAPVDRATYAGPAVVEPVPGDISLCLRCMKISIFDEAMQLREPNPQELQILNARPEIQQIRSIGLIMSRKNSAKN